MSAEPQAILPHIVNLLDENGIPAEKVVLQKFVYFLNTQGVRLGFRFEPYTYGPYSFDLANTLSRLTFWDTLSEVDNQYSVASELEEIDPSLVESLDELLEQFSEIANDDFSFDNMELLGTTLYCSESLLFSGDEVTEDSVVEEFMEWKGDKYSISRIREMFSRISPYLDAD